MIKNYVSNTEHYFKITIKYTLKKTEKNMNRIGKNLENFEREFKFL